MLNVFYDTKGVILAYNQAETGNPSDVPDSSMVSFPDDTLLSQTLGGTLTASINVATQQIVFS